MPLSNDDCPNCGDTLHTDDLIEGYHIDDPWGDGCGVELPDELAW